MKEGAFLQRLIFFRQEEAGEQAIQKKILKLRCRFCCMDTLVFLTQKYSRMTSAQLLQYLTRR